MNWDGTTPIEVKIGDFVIWDDAKYMVVKGGAASPVQMCARCALCMKSACANFNCVGAMRADGMRVYLKRAD